MDCENLIEALESEYKKSRESFFRYAWRERISQDLVVENKYAKLVDWINEKIENELEAINIFNPADKNEEYTMGFLKTYKEACQDLAILLNFKGLLLDDRCNVQMRDNIEYAACKIFNIRYNETLQQYI